MRSIKALSGLTLFFLACSCSSFEVAGEIQAGRQALLVDGLDVASAHFERAVQLDPNYVNGYGYYREGAWTYVGRTKYAQGRSADARPALERALSRSESDDLARLYLGMTLVRDGDRSRGAKEIERALNGLYDWMEYIRSYTTFGKFWDPGNEIRAAIKTTLSLISGADIDWQRVLANGEWIGRKWEEEIDHSLRDEINDRSPASP